MRKVEVGIVGGSGLYSMEGLGEVEGVFIDTPFGAPSDEYIVGQLANHSVAFLPRHGKTHSFLPSEINYRANIYGFKRLGVKYLISVSAVGSLKEEIRPLDMVIPNQFVDFTKGRINTFFGDGVAVHVGFADPVCPVLSNILFEIAQEMGFSVHKGGTYICIEGPQFSSRAESNIYRSLGMDIIGMTNMPEAKLAREAEICYATLALVTDYDVWKEHNDDVTVEQVVSNLKHGVEEAKLIISKFINMLPIKRECQCREALKDAIITPMEHIPEYRREELLPIIGKYINY